MKQILLLLGCTVLFVACKPSPKKLISKKWQAVSMDNPDITPEKVAETRLFFDTVGNSTTPEENEMLYGVRNMDSMREIMKMQLSDMLARQEQVVKKTWMDFQKDGILITSFGTPQPDTVNWYFDDDGNLVLDELQYKGTGSRIMMEVLKLEKDTLRLRFNDKGFSSTVTLKPME